MRNSLRKAWFWEVFCVFLAIALLHGVRSGEMLDLGEGSFLPLYLSRATGVVTYIVCALLYRNRVPDLNRFLALAVGAMVLYLAGEVAAPFLFPRADLTIISYFSTSFYGIASALYRLFFFYVVVRLEPRWSVVVLCAALLVGNVLLCAMGELTNALLLKVRVGMMTICTALLVVAGVLDRRTRSEGPRKAPERLQDAGEVRETFPSGSAEWMLLLVAAAIFHNLFGVISQASSVDGPYFALYDLPTGVILVGLSALLLLFLMRFGTRFDFGLVVIVVTALYATGFAFYSFAWSASSPFAGALIRGGFLCSTVFMWGFMARKSYVRPERSFCYFGVLLAVSSVYPGRLLGSALVDMVGSRASLLHGLSLGALWVICFFGLLAFFVFFKNANSSRKEPSSRGELGHAEGEECANATAAETQGESDAADSFLTYIQEFSSTYGLSEREAAVLRELVHGRSRVAIAEVMFLSPETVKTYISRIYRKTGVRSKQELIDLIEENFSASSS